MPPTLDQIVDRYQLQPHPEGGFFRETYRANLSIAHGAIDGADRSASTAIYFAIGAGDFSAFHRVVPSDEVWHLYAGDPLELHLIHTDGRYEQQTLTTDPLEGEPTLIVDAGCWQAARVAPGGTWSFGGCTVAPGFDFADFEMPGQEELIERLPDHADIVRALSRPRTT